MLKKMLFGLMICLSVLVLSGCGKVYTNTDDYQDYIDLVPGSSGFMPELMDLPEYQSIEVYYYESLGQSINLLVTFSSENYESSKEIVLGSFEFLNAPLTEHDFFLIPEVEFEYKSFIIKVVNNDDFDYPEQFGMMGYSDEKFQISFLFFCYESLHELSNSPGRMTRFIENEFRFPED
jgi:hypothetical protein